MESKKDFSNKIVIELLEKVSVKLTGYYSVKSGKKFNWIIKIDETYGKYVGLKWNLKVKEINVDNVEYIPLQ